jgi:RNA polymerase sigma-70 factor (ECF subfamily)
LRERTEFAIWLVVRTGVSVPSFRVHSALADSTRLGSVLPSAAVTPGCPPALSQVGRDAGVAAVTDPELTPASGPEGAECLHRIARGDRDAALELVQRTQPLVLKLVRAYRSRQHAEQDLVQEVYLTVFAKLDRYKPRAGVPFEHWLARVAVHTCRDVLRAERRRPVCEVLSPQASEWLGALTDEREAPAGDALAARELVERLLAALRPDDRLVLTWLDLEQRSVAEVARLTGWSRTLVKVRAFRARRRLQVVAERHRRSEGP